MPENDESRVDLYEHYRQRLAEIRARREARRAAAEAEADAEEVEAEESEAPEAEVESEETEESEVNEESTENEQVARPWWTRLGFWLAVILLIVLAIIGFKMCSSPAPLTKPTPSPSLTVSFTSWQMKPVNYGDDRWFAEGLAEIKAAKTPEEAASAAQTWLDKVKYDPILLAAAAKAVLNKDVDSKTLFDKDGWATPDTVRLVADMQLALAQAKVTVELAPANGTNTGVVNGSMQYTTGSISGDRSGIKVVLKDGTTFWIMGRCGNVVTPTAPKPTVKPSQSLAPKIASQDPYAQGNAPVGGGPNIDPGPGQYIPPSEMSQPPSTSYSAPPPPTVTTIPTGSTSDPAPPPPPETSAPAPTDPATGYAPPPGM